MTTNDPANDPAEPDVPTTIRPTFHDEVAARSRQFGQDLLKLVPELAGVAIIPAWTRDFNHIFFGVMVGRHGDGLRPPLETMHMAVQLHRALQHVADQSFEFLKYLDNKTAETWERLQSLLRQIQEAEEKLRSTHAQAPAPRWDPAGGAAPGAPPAGEHH
jgi:hypothetical protein